MNNETKTSTIVTNENKSSFVAVNENKSEPLNILLTENSEQVLAESVDKILLNGVQGSMLVNETKNG